VGKIADFPIIAKPWIYIINPLPGNELIHDLFCVPSKE
jgi:hypothetical protein